MIRIKTMNVFKGLIFGVVFSIAAAFLFMLIGQTMAGGVTSFWGESWLYFSVLIPFSITFPILSVYFHNKKNVSNKKLWQISAICAFLVSLFSGTIGAIFGEMIVRGGIESINIEGTLVWGPIYAIFLLPVTIPFARLLIGFFYRVVSR
ncbi:hypothetical protein [Cytobacillus gottheilii]|uniref:hypothetical protein n=1 Tax=Cytobacillus gottheilii TaxID=859144 RepID=UPI001FE9C4B0|nr:hypothetical protein [Cytobacillus gottheilii]